MLLLQNFVENFSEFSAAQRNAGKHVTLMSELSRLVEARTLMTVSLLLSSQDIGPTVDLMLQDISLTWSMLCCRACKTNTCVYWKTQDIVMKYQSGFKGRKCVQVSSTEQEVCCSTGNLTAHCEAVRSLIDSHHITDNDR